jgi:hypothetical protein
MNETGRITDLIESGEILISHHARVRMFERNISTDDLITVEGRMNHDSGSLQFL